MTGTVDSRPGLYLHIPFCAEICPYCDFSVVRSGHPARSQFVETLASEVRSIGAGRSSETHPWNSSEEFGTVYFGGGTPSALTAEELTGVCNAVRRDLPVAEDAHWSLEANPEDVNLESLGCWLELGFSYLSLGVQSFDQPTLEFLGRRHSAAESRIACAQAVASDFETVSLDLMYGMPSLDSDTWAGVLATACGLRSAHLSCYELTVHNGTNFWHRQQRGELELPEESARARYFLQTITTLAEAGLTQYEVSNFARSSGDRSPHNQKYWNSTPYLGVGPSAHSYNGEQRWWNARSLREWSEAVMAQRSPIAQVETLSVEQKRLEWFMTRLRTVDGVELAEYRSRFGGDLEEERRDQIDGMVARGLLDRSRDRLQPTINGLLVADSIVLALAG